jgi:acetylornithine deacetylase/succinyl-diaminopimelate desuccinylase-like protein
VTTAGRPEVATASPVAAFDEMVGHLQALIRLRTVNPPGDEILAARYLAAVLTEAGLEPIILEPYPGRGNVIARLRGDGTGGGPLLLLAHLDVVPADAERWTRDPFSGDIADGYVYGRGAVDMKGMAAMELQVVLGLAREATAAGLDPARDPIPGLRRDLIFAGTADEESGGYLGIAWIVDNEPELLRADGCLTEAGGVSVEVGGRRFYPIQAAEKGFHRFELTVRGKAGHASVPRADNALVLAGRVLDRLSTQPPMRATPLMARAVKAVQAALPADSAGSADDAADGRRGRSTIDPQTRRTIGALLRDTISPTIIHAGTKDNVIPGHASIIIDCRILPGTTEAAMEAELRERIGEDLWRACDVVTTQFGAPLEQPLPHPLFDLCVEVLRRHDPDGVPIPIMAPFATDAKHTARLGIPTYGFSPLRLDPDEPFLERFHGDDERVGLDALRFGLPVLDEVVRRYCG